MNFAELLTDHLIDIRPGYRRNRLWKEADEIRDILDSRNVFVFDTPDFQEVWNLNDKFFDKMPEAFATKRLYVEDRMRLDRQAEARFEAWLFSIQSNFKA